MQAEAAAAGLGVYVTFSVEAQAVVAEVEGHLESAAEALAEAQHATRDGLDGDLQAVRVRLLCRMHSRVEDGLAPFKVFIQVQKDSQMRHALASRPRPRSCGLGRGAIGVLPTILLQHRLVPIKDQARSRPHLIVVGQEAIGAARGRVCAALIAIEPHAAVEAVERVQTLWHTTDLTHPRRRAFDAWKLVRSWRWRPWAVYGHCPR